MTQHYMRLLTDIELNDKQKQIWYRCVEQFLGAEHATQPNEFLDTLTSHRAELEGDDEFPYVYVVYLSDDIDTTLAEQIVNVWNEIYPRDFEIETSTEYDTECGDDVEIDDIMYEEIQRRASKFLHNRWVDDQLQEGWRFGINASSKDKTNPRLRDWDSLREEYRRELPMDRDQASAFFKKHPHLFV
jgi:hypothetical protein